MLGTRAVPVDLVLLVQVDVMDAPAAFAFVLQCHGRAAHALDFHIARKPNSIGSLVLALRAAQLEKPRVITRTLYPAASGTVSPAQSERLHCLLRPSASARLNDSGKGQHFATFSVSAVKQRLIIPLLDSLPASSSKSKMRSLVQRLSAPRRILTRAANGVRTLLLSQTRAAVDTAARRRHTRPCR
jgi:hypothetical protein